MRATPDCAIDAFAAQDAVPMALYRWRRDDADNPYLGYLAMADEIIVTADSISMLSEAYATGKPVHMFDTAAGALGMRHDMHVVAGEAELARALAKQDPDSSDLAPGPLAYRALMRWGWRHLTRDISRMHLRLVRSGRMVWLGESPASREAEPSSDLRRAVDRIADLMGQAAPCRPRPADTAESATQI